MALFYRVHKNDREGRSPTCPVPEAVPFPSLQGRKPEALLGSISACKVVAWPGTSPWLGNAGAQGVLLSRLFWCQLQPLSNCREELTRDSHATGIHEGGTHLENQKM